MKNNRPQPAAPAAALPPEPLYQRPGFIAVLLALLTVAIYWPVVRFDFFNYDDPAYFSENYRVLNGLSWHNVLWAFQTTDISSWYPFMWLSFMLDVTLFGRGAAGPHLTNLVFHVANVLLLFGLLRRLTGSRWRSAVVAALFAVHPLHVESVAWIAERKDVLSTFFGLLALLCYTRYAQARSGANNQRPKAGKTPATPDPRPPAFDYLLALLLFTFGLLSKPMLVTLPGVMLLLDFWPLERVAGFRVPGSGFPAAKGGPDTRTVWQLFREKIPFLLLGLGFGLVTLLVHKESGAISTLATFPMSLRVENAFVAYARYLGKTFWPFNLAVPYPHPGMWPAGLVIGSVLLFALLCALALWQVRRRPCLFVGWFWFVGMLFPVIGLIQWGIQSMADRFTYVPLIGLSIALVWGAEELLSRGRWPARLVAGLVAALLAALALRAADQLACWRDSETLFRHALAVTGDNEIAYANLGTSYAAAKQQDLAIACYRKALALNPNSGETLGNLAVALTVKKQNAEAEAAFQTAIRLLPNKTLLHLNYGNVLLDQDRTDQAIAEFQQAVRCEPDSPQAHDYLGHALAVQHRYAEAVQEYAAALQLNPGYAEAHNNWGLALAEQGDYADAVGHYRTALRLDPNFIEIDNNLGGALLGLGQVDEAIAQFRALLKYKPDHPKALDNLGVALASQGKLAEACASFQAALRYAPAAAGTHYNLANAYVMQRRFEEAIREYREAVRLNPDHAQAHCNLGNALADLGRRTEALPELRRALQLKPDLAQARERLRELGEPAPE
jgi:protein O-mannosyl-transferase